MPARRYLRSPETQQSGCPRVDGDCPPEQWTWRHSLSYASQLYRVTMAKPLKLNERTCRHEAAAHDHQCLIMAFQKAQEPQCNKCPGQNSEANRETAEAHPDRILAIDVECLGRPKHDNREKVGSRDERNEQCESQDSRLLLDTRRKDRVFCAVHFPESKGDHEEKANDQRDKYMGGVPGILNFQLVRIFIAKIGLNWSLRTYLIASPLQTSQEDNQACNAQETAHKINARDDLSF